MKRVDFFLAYFLLAVIQILITNYLHLSQFITLTILPIMVLSIPIRYSTNVALFIAFGTGLGVDLLADGVLGLNTLALVPVAFLRNTTISLIFGEEMFSRKEDFSIRRNGFTKVALAILFVQALFLIIYITADGAGTRPFWFNLLRFICSLITGFIVSIAAVDALSPEGRS